MQQAHLEAFRWLGSDTLHLNTAAIDTCGPMVIGRYGGRTEAGAKHNEDGALAWALQDNLPGSDWEFAMLLDAHNTAQSAALLLDTVENQRTALTNHLMQPAAYAFVSLQEHLIKLFNSEHFRVQAQRVYGETSCLIVARKAGYLWWMCVGDCAVYLLHPDLAKLGQYVLNQRNFYEWIGRSNTFELPVPCYSSGVRELRGGQNTIVMVTDGLLDFGARPFEAPSAIYEHFAGELNLSDRVQAALTRVHDGRGEDSSTIIAWQVQNQETVSQPS